MRLRFHKFVPDSVHQPALETTRMVSLPCNDPAVRGYSACWHGSILHLHAHYEGKGMAFYNNFPPGAIWLYMPVAPGELICDIWTREGQMSRDMALMVSEGFAIASRLAV